MTVNYAAALDYLYGLINYEIKRPNRYTPDVISLERPRQLLALLQDPQEQVPIVHVTGTKGKGSVSAMTASILQAAGLRVGLYSSPHLQDFRERFRVNGEIIRRETLAALVEKIQPLVATIDGLTWWEVITAIAFQYFYEARVDIAVVEVGLGGRLDATNVIKRPLVATITSLSYDHMHLLGNTLAEIAFEKAGIIKPGFPVVSAPQHEEGRLVIEQTALERGSPLTLVGRDYHYEVGASDSNGQYFSAGAINKPSVEYWTPLIGSHQALNAATALATIEHVRKAGFAITDRAIDSGLRTVNWAGRLEVIRRGPWLILDVAHNAESALRLREALTTAFPVLPEGKLILVFGAYTDKDVKGMFGELLPITSTLVLLRANSPRAYEIEQLEPMARATGFSGDILSADSVGSALQLAEKLAQPTDMICVTGSLSVVGEMRDVLGLPIAHAAYLDEASVQALRSR
jgi:dihydrofolate synthase/folylpolyglutamate synthase